MRKQCIGVGVPAIAGWLWMVADASAAPVLRVQVAQHGDFALIGNTLGNNCAPAVPKPVVGAVGMCGPGAGDGASDVHWRADSPNPGEAEASVAVAPADARSSAVLELPPDATVSHAFLYWAAVVDAPPADGAVTLDRPGSFSTPIDGAANCVSVMDGTFNAYQCSADVTATVQTHGGWKTLSTDEFTQILATGEVPKKSVLVTFDDGYLDNWVYAHPVLKEFGQRATLFLITGWMGERDVRPHAGQPGVPDVPTHGQAMAAAAARLAAVMQVHAAGETLLATTLLAIVALHITAAVQLAHANRRARPIGYAAGKPVESTFAQRTIVISGLVILAFIVFHLSHFTIGFVDPQLLAFRDPETGGASD